MASGKFDSDAAVMGAVLATAFNKEAKYRNPFDRRKERKLTPEEIAEEERAIAAKAEVEVRVHARRLARKRERAHGTE